MAKPSSIGTTLLSYSRVSIWLALLFIACGLALQSLQVNVMAQSDVDKAYASAVAEQTALALSTRLLDTRRMQVAASSHPKTSALLISNDINANTDWLNSLKIMLPGATEIEVVTSANIQTLQQKYSFAVQDLANRTLRGNDMKLEAVTLNNRQRFFWASPVPANGTPQGVLLVQYGEDWLNAFRSAAAHNLGYMTVTQKLNPNEPTGINIFTAGESPVRSIDPITIPINNYWFLTFTPSDQRPALSMLSLSFPWLLTLGLTLGSLFIILWVQKRALQKNQQHFIQFLKRYFHDEIKENPKFSLSLFNELAQEVRAASEDVLNDLKSKEKKAAIQQKASQKTDAPQRESGARNDLPEVTDEPELPEIIEPSAALKDGGIPRHIFRAYDIRGLVDSELTDEHITNLGRALGSEIRKRGFERINLAWDGRLSSEHLANTLQAGILSAGCSVNRLGMLPTGALYYSTFELDTPCGVMITGSHNPKEYNGLKIVIDQLPLSEQELLGLRERIINEDYSTGYAGARENNIEEQYLSRIEDDIQISRDMTIVIDAGNGVAGPLAIKLFKELGLEVIDIHCDVDGNFPNHHPDPGEPENLEDLKNAILLHDADLGLAFDGDGDRVALLDNEGTIIWPDRLMMLLIEDILPRRPGSDVLFDVKSSRHLAPMINRLGGRPTMWKTGHSLMKRKLKELKGSVGGEFSGHFYIAERWYGFDDGLYAGARLLEILSARRESVADVFKALPEDVSTPEIALNTTEDRKFTLIDDLAKDEALISEGRVFNTDGLRIEFTDGWGLIRASNTTPRLTLRFAGDNEETILRIQTLMKQALTRHAPEIETPF